MDVKYVQVKVPRGPRSQGHTSKVTSLRNGNGHRNGNFSETDEECPLCGIEFVKWNSSHGPQRSEWDISCLESLGQLFEVDPYRSCFEEASTKYCNSCQQLVWDIDFTYRTLKKLNTRLEFHQQTFEFLLRKNPALNSLHTILDRGQGQGHEQGHTREQYPQQRQRRRKRQGSRFYFTKHGRLTSSELIKTEVDSDISSEARSDHHDDYFENDEDNDDDDYFEEDEDNVDDDYSGPASKKCKVLINPSRLSESKIQKPVNEDGDYLDLSLDFDSSVTEHGIGKMIDSALHEPHRALHEPHRALHEPHRALGPVDTIKYSRTNRRKWTCPETDCSFSCLKKIELTVHVRGRHEKDPTPHHCDLCDVKLTSRKKYLKHRRTHGGRKSGNQGHDSENPDSETGEGHEVSAPPDVETKPKKLQTPRLSCKITDCKFTAVAQGRMNWHIRAQHENDPKPYHCDMCDETFEHLKEHTVHRSKHSAMDIKRKRIEATAKILKCTCTFCGYVALDEELLDQHTVQHQDYVASDPYNCVLCNEGHQFTNCFTLKRHVAFAHNPTRSKCQLCQKAFRTKKGLWSHQKSVHPKDDTLKCNECNYVGQSNGKLSKHVAQVHRHERPFLCNECGLTFATNGRLKIHYYTHTGEKPYVCKLCPKAFHESSKLREHEERHMPSKTYICECSKAFRTGGSIKQHRRFHCPLRKSHATQKHKKRQTNKSRPTFEEQEESNYYNPYSGY